MTVSLVLAWAIYFYGWKAYRLDRFRQDLFALRDELFDTAARGEVAFDDPAYTTLRALINSMIRFAHRVTFSRWVLAQVLQQVDPDPQSSVLYNQWAQAARKLPAHVQPEMDRMHKRLWELCVMHMTKGCLLLLVVYVFYFVKRLIESALKKSVNRTFAVNFPGRDLMEAQAMEAQLFEAEATAVA
jgi:hypothetical protein